MTAGISDSAGNKSESYQFSFTTEATPDLLAPVVTSTTPANAFVGYSIDSSITVTFSEDIDPYSITSSNILVQENGTTISPKLSLVGSVLTITSPSGWINAANYTVVIKKEILDRGNNQMLSDYTFSFDTRYTRIYSSAFHNCVLLPSGKLRCWGGNIGGQLGTGNFNSVTTMDSAEDIRVGEPVLTLSVGLLQTCAILLSGNFKCWGSGITGTLGYESLSTQVDPFYLPGLNTGERIIGLKTAGLHTCIVTESGKYRCWGGNPGRATRSGWSRERNSLTWLTTGFSLYRNRKSN